MRDDRGSASVVATAVVAVAVVVGLAVAAVAGFAAQRAQARAGADLAALAGAFAARANLEGDDLEPCAAAHQAAEANRVALTACELIGDGSVQVAVTSGRATAQARAGPAGATN